MILMHSFDELRQWNINRDYLKYQEGLFSLKSFVNKLDFYRKSINSEDKKQFLQIQTIKNECIKLESL